MYTTINNRVFNLWYTIAVMGIKGCMCFWHTRIQVFGMSKTYLWQADKTMAKITSVKNQPTCVLPSDISQILDRLG